MGMQDLERDLKRRKIMYKGFNVYGSVGKKELQVGSRCGVGSI